MGCRPPFVSVVVPSIRPHNIPRLYSSLQDSLESPFELILVGPYPPPTELSFHHNLHWIKDFGSPARCMNIGVAQAKGELITFGADDGYVLHAFDDCVNKFCSLCSTNYVVTAKYTESDHNVHSDEYYQLNKAYPHSPFIPDSWRIFNIVFMYADFYRFMGGVNSKVFSVSCMALADLAVRSYIQGIQTSFVQEPTWHFDWAPSHVEGSDHKPIEIAQAREWEIYRDRVNRSPYGVIIDYNNWMESPSIWERFESGN